jgi:hypothetical protein
MTAFSVVYFSAGFSNSLGPTANPVASLVIAAAVIRVQIAPVATAIEYCVPSEAAPQQRTGAATAE